MVKSKKVTKKPAQRTTIKGAKKTTPKASRPTSKARRSWLNKTGQTPQIESYARKLRSFINALADGVVDDSEVESQEQGLVRLMKEIEPQLDDALHARVTELLCELTAYDIMRLLHAMHATRPKGVFRG